MESKKKDKDTGLSVASSPQLRKSSQEGSWGVQARAGHAVEEKLGSDPAVGRRLSDPFISLSGPKCSKYFLFPQRKLGLSLPFTSAGGGPTSGF